jgi:excisionase family DNA binding protein
VSQAAADVPDGPGALDLGLRAVLRPIVAEIVRDELAAARPPERADDEAVPVAEVARFCHVSRKVVYGAIGRGDLAASRLGSRLRVRRSDVDAWLEATRVGPDSPPSAHRRGRPRARPADSGLRRMLVPNETKETR